MAASEHLDLPPTCTDLQDNLPTTGPPPAPALIPRNHLDDFDRLDCFLEDVNNQPKVSSINVSLDSHFKHTKGIDRFAYSDIKKANDSQMMQGEEDMATDH
jgi:hypothetical protein